MREINKNLKEQRNELHLTQSEVALMLGVTRYTYYKWEMNPDLMSIGRYEQLMGEFERLRARANELKGE